MRHVAETLGQLGMRAAVSAARLAPRSIAAGVISSSARRIARSPSGLQRASRVNQYIVSGRAFSGAELDAAVEENIRQMIFFLYDLYRVIGDPEKEDALVLRDEAFYEFIERDRADGPFVYVGAHMGNFDLVGRVLGRNGWRMQILSVPAPSGSYVWQNETREQVGFEMTPVSMESLKAAARRLEAGKSVLTAQDRPMAKPDKVQPRFFGEPAPLPLLHVRLAMRAGVPVVPLAARRLADGRYGLVFSEPVVMAGDKQTPEALRANAEACLAPLERWIAETPGQWSMPHAVWSDVGPPVADA